MILESAPSARRTASLHRVLSRPAEAPYIQTMIRHPGRTRSGIDSRRPAVVALLCAALAGCSSSSGPSGETDRYRGAYEPRTHHFELTHATTPVRSAGLDLLPGDARADSAGHVHVQVAIRNSGTAPRFGPRGVQVDAFAPASVWPLNAGCRHPIPGDLLPQCVFWHFDSYGPDHTLGAGRTSVPVEWIFDDPGDLPFEFTAWLWWPHG